MIARCSVHILPIQRPLIQLKLGRGTLESNDWTENMAQLIVVGVAFIPKDDMYQVIFSAGFQWVVLDWIGIISEPSGCCESESFIFPYNHREFYSHIITGSPTVGLT